MRFIDYYQFTPVSRVVKDLEAIVRIKADTLIPFPYHNGKFDNYISGARVLNNLGFLLLESSSDKKDALTAKQLLERLKDFSPIKRVVVQDGWRIVNLGHEESWDYDYECDFPDESIVMGLTDEDEVLFGSGFIDIRLSSSAWLVQEMEERFADATNLKIVCLDENGCVYPVNAFHCADSVINEEGCGYLSCGNTDDTHVIRVSDFIAAEGNLFDGLAVNCAKDGKVLRAIEVEKDGYPFFKTNIAGEDVIACRLGDIIRGLDHNSVIDTPRDTMIKDDVGDVINYLKHLYIPELKKRIDEDWEIAERDEDDFDCEFEDDEYVQCIAHAEGRARAREKVVRELDKFLTEINC